MVGRVLLALLVVFAASASAVKVQGTVGTLKSLNLFNGTGSYYLPRRMGSAPLPLAVLLHDSTPKATGMDMVKAFWQLADSYRFIIVAPDSSTTRRIGAWTQADVPHVFNCLEEVAAMRPINRDRLVIAGFGGGASMAALVGMNFTTFSALGLLHDMSFQLINRHAPHVFLSSGVADQSTHWPYFWAPSGFASAVRHIQSVCNLPSLTTKNWPIGHNLHPLEKNAFVNWWLMGQGSVPLPKPAVGGPIPRLPATTASARELQRRMAAANPFAIYLNANGSVVSIRANTTKEVIPPFLLGIHAQDPLIPPYLPTRQAVEVSAGQRRDYLSVAQAGTVDACCDRAGLPDLAETAATRDKCQREVVSVAAGMQHQVVLYKDGTVSCHLERYTAKYGVDVFDTHDYLGVCHVRPRPGGKQRVVAVSAGAYHTLALTDLGGVVAWGCNTMYNASNVRLSANFSQCKVPKDLQKAGVVSIAAGNRFSLALLTNGTVRVWGRQEMVDNMPAALAQPNARNPVVAISASNHAFALRANGDLTVWGPRFEGKVKPGTGGGSGGGGGGGGIGGIVGSAGAASSSGGSSSNGSSSMFIDNGGTSNQGRVVLQGVVSMKAQNCWDLEPLCAAVLVVRRDGSLWYHKLEDMLESRHAGLRLAEPGTMAAPQ